ncbi:AarF/ABC1/UbiB kinase family protein [bacterium]|nr:AarF/ABC1/UbiB kinase family protein [bacterium]QQR58669.1 MAG: AarF/ABC1/UbiB kinase family protein [Candidatus Melainabacteria bacterium]
MKEEASTLGFNPINEAFKDVSRTKLLASSWRIFQRIRALQGTKKAMRVFPIVWTVIKTVRGFSRYHAQEFERATEAGPGQDAEEAALSSGEYEEYRELGRWLAAKLHELGPTFIKIGQTLSTRADLLPLPAMLELARLQENVDAFPWEIAHTIIKNELGGEPTDLFAEFNQEPIAAASLAQAYLAKLKDGRDIVLKVQRPGLAQILADDVQIIGAVADEVMSYPSLCRHTNWPEIVEEFARTTFEEIDYIREGRNADTFRRDFRNFPKVFIPRIIWRFTGRKVLAIEYVKGFRVDDIEQLERGGFDREEITRTGTSFYLTQLLENGFFHADPHPGNMRVMEDGRIGIFDFGMVGKLSPELKAALVNSLLHVTQKDYRALVDDFVDMGLVSPEVDREALCADLTPIIDTRMGEGMSKVRFRKMLFDFSNVCYRYPFRLPSEFTYIMRALLTLEGVAVTVNPKFNFLNAVMPFAHKLLMQNQQVIRDVLFKEVFQEGKFNSKAAFKLFKTAANLTSNLLG